MRFDIITLFPEIFDALKNGITGRALTQELIKIKCWNPRDFTDDPNKRIDDRPYGGGPGMVMAYLPLHNAIVAAKNDSPQQARVIYLSPQGKLLTQAKMRECAKTPEKRLILIAGRYEGIDERVIQKHVDEEWSIGDYVLSGGELPAMVLIDAITRLLPNALGDADSAAQDSFENDLLDHPHYTRPETIDGLTVPTVLQSGDHAAINRWRRKESLGKTWQKRPDLLKRRILNEDERNLLQMYIDETE
ncbi:MAG: tRNA (guanosine(37)-N1)-methyltransferase TrmD [Gammaproteobacteria bacterium CG_4_10_14_0_8_um_filter_38_16]|nr:MAG: tRNA (guanosine(37)-N1)-methyltransferase TrmD [Gammaproteobacteria bacterium CG_4_10_14_0_8_um_filter_38_16]PJA03303.1 MAG: tRNA (guanosine(37)-N1)-methyltransferase TrmD [Gammaproteobacteria bacterium CG_4_10_14_0_2_um_filter_38_22]